MKTVIEFFQNGVNNFKGFFKSYKTLVLKSKVNTVLLVALTVAGIAELFTDLRGGLLFAVFVLAVQMYFAAYWKNEAKGKGQ